MKKILIISSGPMLNDGMAKIEMDIIKYNSEDVGFEIACGFDYSEYYVSLFKKMGIVSHRLSDKNKPVAYMSSIKKLVKAGNYDAVYIHGNSGMMFFEAFPAKRAGAYVITHCHSTSTKHALMHRVFKPFMNMNVDVKIGCSKAASKWAYNGRRVKTISNGIDIKRFRFNKDDRAAVRNQILTSKEANDESQTDSNDESQTDSCKLVGHIGRFSDQKNHQKLIAIFECMHNYDASTRLVLIGSGENERQILEDIEKRGLKGYVQIVDYTDTPEKYMSAMDIMIMPSLFEGLCLVALEAQANGLPILVSDNFAEETFATSKIEKLSLEECDEAWADRALFMMKSGHEDVSQELYLKNMDEQDMMNSIRAILIENVRKILQKR